MSSSYLSRYPYALQDKYSEVDVMLDTLRRSQRARTELSDRLLTGLSVDKGRYAREFMTPAPHSTTGLYYPNYPVSGHLESGSVHIPYLSRSYLNYRAANKYGYNRKY